jgi:hypothetical protein
MNANATMCVEWEATERLPEGSCQAQFALRGAVADRVEIG